MRKTMRKIMSLAVAGTIAVFAASSTFADKLIVSTNMNSAPTVSVMQDDDQMGNMKSKKSVMKKGMKKKPMSMKKKSGMKKGMKMKKKMMKKKSGMGNMKMKDMD